MKIAEYFSEKEKQISKTTGNRRANEEKRGPSVSCVLLFSITSTDYRTFILFVSRILKTNIFKNWVQISQTKTEVYKIDGDKLNFGKNSCRKNWNQNQRCLRALITAAKLSRFMKLFKIADDEGSKQRTAPRESDMKF